MTRVNQVASRILRQRLDLSLPAWPTAISTACPPFSADSRQIPRKSGRSKKDSRRRLTTSTRHARIRGHGDTPHGFSSTLWRTHDLEVLESVHMFSHIVSTRRRHFMHFLSPAVYTGLFEGRRAIGNAFVQQAGCTISAGRRPNGGHGPCSTLSSTSRTVKTTTTSAV